MSDVVNRMLTAINKAASTSSFEENMFSQESVATSQQFCGPDEKLFNNRTSSEIEKNLMDILCNDELTMANRLLVSTADDVTNVPIDSSNEVSDDMNRDDFVKGSVCFKKRTKACSISMLSQQKPKRRSGRNTNRLAFSHRSSLQYRRLHDLFFLESNKGKSSSSSKMDYIAINNLKLYPVCSAPNIYTIPNFLTESELQHLHNKINKCRFQRSFVDKSQGQLEAAGIQECDAANSRVNSTVFDDQHRTSTFLSFQKQEDKKIQSIEQRAAELLGYWSSSFAVEPLQLVRYLPGQFFGIHHDLGDYNPETGTVLLPPKSCLSKRRLVTIFVYLNECTKGGATHFPAAAKRHIRILPSSPGTAVLFCNVLENGQPDPRTIHEGERVGEGCIKYGLNIWLCEA